MILVRLDRIPGNVKFPGYSEYFVANSLDFGVGRSIDSSDKNSGDISLGKSATQNLCFDKNVDEATVYLMHAAMKNRTKTDGPTTFCIDIHFIQSRRYEDTRKDNDIPAPYLKVRIENAILQDWKISGSNDERPTESIEIWFNKAAMKYYATDDGKEFKTHGPLGWDQQANESWKSSILEKK